MALLISVYGKFLINHLTKVMKEEFKYHLGLVKKDTNLFQDTISFKDTYLKGNSELPIIRINVEGTMCNLLLDTGANINILNESVFDKINKNQTIKVVKAEEHITVGSGSMEQTGVAKLNFAHQKLKFVQEFDILNMSAAVDQIAHRTGITVDGILGSKFFKDNQWSLDFDTMVVWVK